MKSRVILSLGAQLAVAALVLLGIFGGSLIVAHSGFGTSPRHGGTSTFVPAPQAYFLAAIMYAMAAIALLALLQSRKSSRKTTAIAVAVGIGVAVMTAMVLAPP